MTPEQRALRDAYLSELWPVCRELPRHERAAKRKEDRIEQRRLEEIAIHSDSPVAEAM